MRWLWSKAVSLRTTAWLLALLGSLLLLNVALPQRAHDPDAYSRSVRASPVARVLLVTLQLGELPTSVVFVGTLTLLFANLVAVLVDRVGATTRRMRFASPTPAQVAALDASPDACEADTAGLTAAAASELLRAIGYRVADLSGGRLWGVKHRLALLGFPLFHSSFVLMAGGGLLIFLSRDVTTLVVSEGEAVSSDAGSVVRRAPLGAPPPVVLGVERVDVRLEDGKPIDLGARLVHLGGGGARASRINRPAEWGDLSVLTERAGIAPVLWVVDERGFTVDRVVVAAAAAGGAPTRVTIGGTLEAVVEPIPIGSTFPERGALRAVPVRLRLRSGARTLFDGSLVPGESAGVGGLDVRLQEVRYWVGLRLIHERGGPLLVAGFLLSVAGIIWRMVWVRREVVVTLCAGRLRVAARAEFFTSRGREEAAAVAAMLAESGRSRE